jgi:isopentenyl phosphate kinase
MSRGVQIVKIGGSIITDKFSEEPVFAAENARRMAMEISRLPELPVIVHGTGSYGKPPAKQYGYLNGVLSKQQAHIISKVSGILESLRQNVLDTFRQAGVPAIGLSAGSLFVMRRGAIVDCHWEPVLEFLRKGVVPIIAGDFVNDREADFAVCSSDWIAAHLAISAKAQRLLFVTDVPGVLDAGSSRQVDSQVIAREDCARWQQSVVSAQNDVSRGMQGKLAAAFLACEHGVDTYMVDGTIPESVFEGLNSDTPNATRFVIKNPARLATAGSMLLSGEK